MTTLTHRRTGRQLRTFPVKVKETAEQDGQHTFEALVSVFGNVDAYGDRMVRGAFADTLAEWKRSGDPIPVIWSHRWDDPKYIIGEVLEAEERAEGLWVRGLLDDDARAETAQHAYRALKGRRVKQFSFAFDYQDLQQATVDGEPELDEWGWPIFDVLAVKLHEVGPCLVGANDQTQLYEVRHGHRVERRAAIGSHSTETSDAEWDAGTHEANLSNDDGAAVYRRAYAWVDSDGDPDAKGSYKFIHHFVSDGSPGAASTRAASNGIGVLNGGRGGANIPDSDRKGVYNHLARHLRDADMEPPELRTRGRVRVRQAPTDVADLLDELEDVIDEIRDRLDLGGEESQTRTQPGLPARPAGAETDGKAHESVTRGPAAWMTAFEAAGQQEIPHGHRAGDQ